MKIAWFSAGVSSAVATKLSNPDIIFYNHVEDMHPDTERFIRDCEAWFGKKVTRMDSPVKTVENACRLSACITIPRSFTACTKHLKIRPRQLWESANPGRHTYVWGMDKNETSRMDGLRERMPQYDHEFPLANMTKAEAHGYLEQAGIKRPAIYAEGYPNGNCIGCIRGGMGYWNKIRREYPGVFENRAKLERLIGHSIINGVYLDELAEDRGRKQKIIVAECGAACELF